MTESSPFKICPMCAAEWRTREAFIEDSSLELNGYGADFEKLELSLFYFTHRKEGCYSTLTLEAKAFQSLYSGKKYSGRRTGEDDCPGYCFDKEQLNRCDAFCECAFNREILAIIKEKK